MITLALCTNRGVKPKTVQALLELRGDFMPLVAEQGYTIAENRNYAVIQAQKNNSSHILFIDDDMVFPFDTLERLLAHGREIVGVNSYSRILPLSSTVALLDENGGLQRPEDVAFPKPLPDKLFECFGVGAGVLLIDMEVFDVIEKPWFHFEALSSGKISIGEDGWFCMQARKAGFNIYCDPSLPIGHIGDFIYARDSI